MSHWSDAGFGTDPEGDARRRAEQGVIELPDGTRVAGAPDAPTAIAALRAHGLPAIPLGAALPDGRTLDDLRAASVVEVVESDGHAITATRHGSAVALVCECGRWDAVVSGRGSATWAGADYRRHVADELRGTRDA